MSYVKQRAAFSCAERIAYNTRMPTLRRILKYLPSVVLGLLVVAWVVSVSYRVVLFQEVQGLESSPNQLVFGIAEGSVMLRLVPLARPSNELWIPRQKERDRRVAGKFLYGNTLGFQPPLARTLTLAIPFAFLTTSVLPLAIGPFTGFRFRLWHYLAYTALVAVELAYYLRRQE
jgi:hypothetical protein